MQTSLKEQDKSWQKRMQKLSGSYRDQLRGVSWSINIRSIDTFYQTVMTGACSLGNVTDNLVVSQINARICMLTEVYCTCIFIIMQSVAKLETLEQTVLEGSRIDEQNKVSKKLKSLQQVAINCSVIAVTHR